MRKAIISAEEESYIRENIAYSSDTGHMWWKVAVNSRTSAGKKIGFLSDLGYLMLVLNKRRFYVHRIAWFLEHGVWPTNQIDHINGNKSDNRLCNLRNVSVRINMENLHSAKSNSRSGFLGVLPAQKGRKIPWKAAIRVNGKTVHLGSYWTPEEAHAAYVDAKRKLHEGCAI